jgi:hypothetical protein
MKINALRVAAFRRFTDPAAIEDFSGGINVLAGPNEMGKSTFFRALEAAFLTRHKVTGAVLNEMRPFTGGEPMVEADFSQDGRRWRVRKQFGRGNAATLTDLTAGRVVARNAEAEDQLAALIGKPNDLHGPLGLVWVRQQHTLVRPDPDVDADTGKEKARGELGALQAAIGREVETAAGGEAFQRVQQLTAKALDVLLTNTRNAPKKNGPLDVARSVHAETLAELKRAEQAAAGAEQRLQMIATLSDELAVLSAPETAAVRRLDLGRREGAMAAEVKRRADLDLAREALKARVLEAERARSSIEAARKLQEQITALEAQQRVADDLERDIAVLAEALNSDAATRPRIEQLNAWARERDIADAELNGDAARIDITLEAGGLGRLRVDGELVAKSVSRNVTEHIDIAIDGIGAIRVSAPGAERVAAARHRRADAVQQINALLALIGTGTIADAQTRAEARARTVEALDRARAKLSGLAPGGAAGIVAIIDRLTAEHRAMPATDMEAQSLEATARAARDRFDYLNGAVMSDAEFRAAAAALDMARQADKTAAEVAHRLAMRIDNLKSEQAGADEDGRAGQVDALNGTLERHAIEVRRLEAEGKALLLLARTLDSIESQTRTAFYEPVTRRLQPHLHDVFGAADLGFKEDFAISGLTRDGQREDFASLSDGTREQLSVLVRLSFAELLAQRGVPVPLVLDDPLVYSDDDRLAKVCRVLERASADLQIVVLTCRATAFQMLPGHRLSVTAWRPEA